MSESYRFSGELFLAAAQDPWVFVAVPSAESDEILELVPRRPGFGSVRVMAKIGTTEWPTSLFPSKELGAYLLPVKKAVRTKEKIGPGDTVKVALHLEID
ncbi:MAG: DUF1905 domain-containing protein [bacterium]|nr:DUF1905 domain-containing protein [bacterium]